jgi:hypothetical protein
MTICTVKAKVGGNNAHCSEEIVYGQSFETGSRNILEDFSRCLPFSRRRRLRGGTVDQRDPAQPNERHCSDR